MERQSLSVFFRFESSQFFMRARDEFAWDPPGLVKGCRLNSTNDPLVLEVFVASASPPQSIERLADTYQAKWLRPQIVPSAA